MEIKEVDFIALAKKLLAQKKKLAVYVAIGAVIGTVVAFSTPKRFTANVLLAPELSSGGLGLSSTLADMASQFGFSVNNSNNSIDAIYPEIYPDILNSIDFVHTLFDVPIITQDNPTPRPFAQYRDKEFKMPFWDVAKFKILAWFKKLTQKEAGTGDGSVSKYILSKKDYSMCENIMADINCLVDRSTSEIALSFTDQDPLTAAIMADTIQLRLQQYITEYKTHKARIDYEFYAKLYKQAQEDFESAKKKYTDYTDSHQSVNLATYTTQRDILEREMQMASDIVTQTKAQMLSAETKIQERTPAYTILAQAKMPHRPSSMPRSLVILIWMFLAGVFFTAKLFISSSK